jgi:NTP pyrophosphatase (non-canonical NTP hydrolase)
LFDPLSKEIDLVHNQDDVFEDMTKQVLDCNKQNGWFTEGTDYSNPDKVGAELALIHSEVSEMLEAYRKRGLEVFETPEGKPDDVGSEAADVLIRLLDFCGRRGINLSSEFDRKMAYNWTRSHRHGGKLL